MLNEVDAEIRDMDLTQASVKQMDGEALDFADTSFDHLLCGYTIFWFSDVIEPFEIVHTTVEAWWEEKWAHGSRAPLEQMPPDVRDRFKTEVLAKLTEMKEDGVYRTEWKTCFVIAQKREPRE